MREDQPSLPRPTLQTVTGLTLGCVGLRRQVLLLAARWYLASSERTYVVKLLTLASVVPFAPIGAVAATLMHHDPWAGVGVVIVVGAAAVAGWCLLALCVLIRFRAKGTRLQSLL